MSERIHIQGKRDGTFGHDETIRGRDIVIKGAEGVKALRMINVDGRHAPCIVQLDLLDGTTVEYETTHIEVTALLRGRVEEE